METGFSRLMVRLFTVLPGWLLLDVAPPPTEVATPPSGDVAPPLGLYVALGAGALVVLCLLVAVVVVVAFFVIRAIKKNRAAKDNP